MKAGICTKDFTVSRTTPHSLRQFLLFIVLPSHCYHIITLYMLSPFSLSKKEKYVPVCNIHHHSASICAELPDIQAIWNYQVIFWFFLNCLVSYC